MVLVRGADILFFWNKKQEETLFDTPLHQNETVSSVYNLSRKAEMAENLPRAAHGALTGSATLSLLVTHTRPVSSRE